MQQFSWNMFMTACILSGCDYLDNIPRLGSTSVLKLVSTHKTIVNVL